MESMSDRATSGFKAPKPPFQILNRNDAHKRMKMSQNTYEDDDINHDYLEEDVDINDLVIPSSNVDNIAGDNDIDGGKGTVKPLQMQIAEPEVEILTAKCALLRIQSVQHVQSSGGAIAERIATLWSYTSEQRSRRRRISK